MDISRADWEKYKNKQAAISEQAANEFGDWIEKKGGYINIPRNELISYAYALSTKYGEASAALSAQMFDEIAALSGKTIPSAEVAETSTYGELAKAINGATKKITTNDKIKSIVGAYVKRAGADTTLKNAEKHGGQFAWIPMGDTCVFCLELASYGWKYMSKGAMENGHASHIHANCDCEYAVRFDEKTNVQGYDPDVYKRMFDEAEGNTRDEKLNYIRRIQYNKDQAKITAQKRANDHDKKFLESLKSDTKAYFKELVDKYHLTYSEGKALIEYISSKAYSINEKLRNGTMMTEIERKLCNDLDSALTKIPTYKGNLSRSLYFYNQKEIDDYVSNYKVGEKFTVDQYVSTTKSKNLYNPEGQVQIYIEKSKKGHDISALNTAEIEVLYERGSEFVTVYKKLVNDTWYILLREV